MPMIPHVPLRLSSVALSALCSTVVLGQEQFGSRGGLEEVLVTAERVVASQQDTPISLTAFDQQSLENLGVIESGDIAAYTPNLRMNKTPASQNAYGISIRGIASSEPSLAIDPTVGIYIDGIYIGRNSAAAFEIVDMERIEVLRGPQGTLFGRNTTGGAINIVTQKPSGEFGFEQKVTMGERELLRSATSIETPEWSNLSARLSFTHGERGGLVRSAYTGGDLGQYDQQAVRLAVRWTPTERLVADYTFDHFQQDSNTNLSQISFVRPLQLSLGGGQYEQAAAAASPRRSGSLPFIGDGKDQSMEIDGHALTLAWEADSYTLKSISSWREFTNRYASQGFGEFPSDGQTLLSASFDGTTVPAGDFVQMFDSQGFNEHEQWSQEFQVIGALADDRLSYTAGVYFFGEKGRQADPQQFVFPALLALGSLDAGTQAFLCAGDCFGKSIVLNSGANYYEADNDAWALYSQFTYDISPKWAATLGMRWSEDERELRLTNTFDDVGETTLSASDSWSKFNPNLTMTYTASDDLMLYGKIATGYRAGGYNVRATTQTSFEDPVNEENVTSFELGGKSEWMENRVRLNGALFYYEYEDQQVSQFEAGSGGASSKLVNAGESEAWGAELELTVMPTDALLATFSYGYTDLSYNKFITSVSDPITGFPARGEDGEPLTADIANTASTIAGSPKSNASAILQYTFPHMGYGQWIAQFDVAYSGDRTFQTQLNLYDRADSYTLFNARLTLADIPVPHGELSVAAWGRNLGNEKVREFGVDFGALGFAVNTYRELRSVGFDLSYRY